MLARQLSKSHIYRSTRLVLPHLQKFHSSKRSSSDNSIDPILVWEPGSGSNEYLSAKQINPEVPRLLVRRHRKNRIKKNPKLYWDSYKRRNEDGEEDNITKRTNKEGNDDNITGYRKDDDDYITELKNKGDDYITELKNDGDDDYTTVEPDLKIPWLNARKNILEPKLAWQSELSEGIGALLEKSESQVVRRLVSHSGLRSSGDGLVRRYTLDWDLERGQEERKHVKHVGLIRRIEGGKQEGDIEGESLAEPGVEILEAQRQRLSQEETVKQRSIKRGLEALEARATLKRQQKLPEKQPRGELRIRFRDNEGAQGLGHKREVTELLEGIQSQREGLEVEQQAQAAEERTPVEVKEAAKGKPQDKLGELAKQERSILRRVKSKGETLEIEQEQRTKRLQSKWKALQDERKTPEKREIIRRSIGEELKALGEKEESRVRRVQSIPEELETERDERIIRLKKRWEALGDERETPERREEIRKTLEAELKVLGLARITQAQDVQGSLEAHEDQQITLKTKEGRPLIRREEFSTPGFGIYRQKVPIFFRSEEERIAFEDSGVKHNSELIRYTLVARRYTPHPTGPGIRFLKSIVRNPNELRTREALFGNQQAIKTGTEMAEESVRDTTLNDVGVGGSTGEAASSVDMKAEQSIGEAVPNDTNLAVDDNSADTVQDDTSLMAGEDGEFIPYESNATITEKRQHDLKRSNPNLEDLVGSYQKVPPSATGDKKVWKVEPKSGKKRKVLKQAKEGSTEIVLNHDVEHLLSSLNISQEEDTPLLELPGLGSEIRLTVSEISSMGDGLAVYKNRVYTVPFGVPGDQVNATVRCHNENHSVAKIASIVLPSPNRDESLVKCKYFGTCSGCQFQMLPYAIQLEHKRKVVEKAFKNFSNLPPELLPEVGETMSSPLEYGYRTKLTPHFNGPRRGGFKPDMPTPNIGFFAKDPRFNMDIEDCPIGTDAVRIGMKERRAFVEQNLATAFKRGATLLLRESTIRTYLEDGADMGLDVQLNEDGKKYLDKKLCITDNNARSIEYIGDLKFDNPAGSFFQNNNSILLKFTSYIRENLNLPVVKKAEGSEEVIETTERPKYLVDAYCGSGLFSITCGQGLERVWGIDVDKSSIASARKNALENNIANASFMDSPAEDIFGKLKFPGSETSLIIDPPKKGCDKRFLDQLLDFAPKRVVYVSCNVHTQARDIGYILTDDRGKGYRIDSIRGCDFFPQTHHVEGVVVMTKVD